MKFNCFALVGGAAINVENAYSIIDILLRSAVMTRKVRSYSQHSRDGYHFPALCCIAQ
jgi:hypothetical protein